MLLGPGQAISVGTLQPNDSVPINFQLAQATRAVDATGTAQYYNSTDTTLEDIAGSYYYNNLDQDKTRRRRDVELLFARLQLRLSAAWKRIVSGRLDRDNHRCQWAWRRPAFNAHDTTLYIVDLKPSLQIMSGTLTLPPGLFTWQAENPNGPPIAPYDVDVYPGTHVLQFSLARPSGVSNRARSDMHLQGYGSNPAHD